MRARFVLAAGAAALLLVACSSGGTAESKASSSSSKATTTTVAPTLIVLARGDVGVQSAGGDVVLDEPTQQAVLGAAQHYVDVALVAPLHDGAVDEGYETLFDAPVAANATGADRAALTDEGIPPVTATPTVTGTPVRIDGLADRDGHLQLVATTFTVAVEGTTASGPLAINRSVELTFAPSPDGSWRITAYRVSVGREAADASTATTAAAGQ
jgi:hypothetical protein